ncbi:Mu transposase C-terminal domain-containing protein [Mesorhizobium sp. NZP2298]|uniref:Mu transposase C-terminal domain-containing protein n=1 Tax=Mesorhizobium sp. NZP2298 TaxID=2483403 RepID=UPI0015521BED|nr:Mu transposase C-terminal domain-containing protein [Mesorhizobium sp. NZP2298]QKC97172.1 hypothetical protein EB231_22670 [Mesorhizobium sp. NZP2298]
MNSQNRIIVPEGAVYFISILDRVLIGGAEYVWVSTDDVGHVFAPKQDRERTEGFTHARFKELLDDGTATVESDFYAEGKAPLRNFYDSMGIRDLAEDKARQAMLHADICNQFIRMREKDRTISLSQVSLERVLPQIEARLKEGKKKRCGTKRIDFDMPCPRHFRRILKTYVESGYRPIALANRCRGPRSRASSVRPCDLQVWMEFAGQFADRRKPKMSVLLRELKAAVDKRNLERQEQGLPLLTAPSRKQFEKLVHGLDPFFVTARREGEAAAREKFRITYQGLDVERPLERVEMDEWRVDLMTLLVHLKVWERMSKIERKAVHRSRLWATVAIDCATRYMLAIKFFATAPNAASAAATLEMAVLDKSRLNFLLGTTAWIGHGTPEHVVTDGGSAFISFEFRCMLAELGIAHSLPPAGVAKLRPYIESLFKSLTVQFLHWFEGRTFSDYIEKGDYDPEENASVCVDELNHTFAVGVQHVYNNQPHAGLAGETPHNAWLRLSRKFGVIPPPSRDIQRHVFGINCSRKIGDKGICILGIHYNSRPLQDLRVKAGQTVVRVRFDRFGLKRISVWNGDGWMTVNSSFDLPDDLSVWEWVGAVKELRRIHADNAERNLSSVYQAINGLRASGDAAAARAELGSSVLTEQRIRGIEREHFRGITVVEDKKAAKADLVPLERPHDPLHAGIDAFPETFGADQEEGADPHDNHRDDQNFLDESTPNQLGGVDDLKFNDE